MKKQQLSPGGLLLLITMLASSCSSYKQNIMFGVSDQTVLQKEMTTVERNYIIQINDYLQVEVYTNKGERIIDPDFQLSKEMGNTTVAQTQTIPTYLVDIRGICRFPMIGELKVNGLKLRDAEEILQKEYSTYYKDAFVVLKYINKRVIILGAPGGQVIPLANDNMKLVEVLALAKGLNNDAKAHNIRVLRQEQVFLVDLTTIEGYLKNNMVIEPGDVIYVEPVRRPFLEGLRDYGVILSVITSLTTLAVILARL
ncbi:MAG: polysaccharide biosynthesis/export family protein [Chryseolinea sp.]